MLVTEELRTRLHVYRQATGHSHPQAVARLLDIALTQWETDPHYMPERVCGRVRTVVRPGR